MSLAKLPEFLAGSAAMNIWLCVHEQAGPARDAPVLAAEDRAGSYLSACRAVDYSHGNFVRGMELNMTHLEDPGGSLS